MRKNALRIRPLFVLVLLSLFSCAGLQKQLILSGAKYHAVNIEASSYKFVPNNIRAWSGGTITFRIRNGAKNYITSPSMIPRARS